MTSYYSRMVASWTYLLLLSVIASAVRGLRQNEAPCQHKDDVENAVHGVYLEPHQHVSKRVANQPIRISVFYDTTVNTSLSAAVRTKVQTIMPQLTSFLSQTLQVKPVGVPILLDRQCTTSSFNIANGVTYCSQTCAVSTTCGQASVPSAHLAACRQCNGGSTCTQSGTNGAGVANTDFVFYVSATSTSPCGSGTAGAGSSTLAFATYCQTESSLDRPIAGNINFCPSALTTASDDYILSVAKHEAIHALGFSIGLFPFWRDETGAPRTPRVGLLNLPPLVNGSYQYSNTTIKPLTYTNWAVSTGTISHPVNLLVTPTVVAMARTYFNCSSLVGVELENQGGTGTMISHWEKRLLGNELLTGIVTFNPLLSALTLAALQDSGWYQVNYSMAQPLVWGNSAGCQFATSSCGGYITSRLASGSSIDPFCNISSAAGINQLGCTVDREAVSYCNLVKYSSALPADYQYFSALGSTAGGSIEIADFCPFQDIFTYSSTGRGTYCTNATNNISPPGINYLGETYGPGSACLNQGTKGWSVTTSGTIYTPGLSGAGCYQYTYTNNSVTIAVLGTSYSCLAVGQQVNVSVTFGGSVYSGSLLCPPYNQLPAAGGSGQIPTAATGTPSGSTPTPPSTSAGSSSTGAGSSSTNAPNMALQLAGLFLLLLCVMC